MKTLSKYENKKYINIDSSENLWRKLLLSVEAIAQSDLNRRLLDKKLIYSHDIIRVFERVNSILKR